MQVTNQLSEEDKDLIRQGERTIDNLKRLFAVVFALSITALAAAAIEKLRPLLTAANAAPPDFRTWLLNAEMIAVFVVTAGVFYHQSAKFLDIRYAKDPLSRAHPLGFALDYVTLILTAAPFFLMAHAFGPSVTSRVGYLWFFCAYVVLVGFGLILLLISELRHSSIVREKIFNETIAAEEIARESILRTYWLVMNSFILLVLVGLFDAARFLSPCPVSYVGGQFPIFLYWFGIIALLRDYLDFRYAWRFLYPVRSADATSYDKWPITAIAASKSKMRWRLASYIFMIITIVLFWHLGAWNVRHWISECTINPIGR